MAFTAPSPAETVLVPDPSNQRAYRHALGAFTTGVTVVTAMAGNMPIGMTVNSFASISLDPPLVMWSPAKSASKHPLFLQADHFAVHVLAAEQVHLCSAFTRGGSGFDAMPWSRSQNGVPILQQVLVRLDCRRSAAHDAGDHTIIIGEVLQVTEREGDPLCFSRGMFGHFTRTS
ncbi:flavin reductase family protein [Endobacterium cereale]|nr:flavin reductase family protein [Endobacterium cereale]MEB2844483.1 flavin reductase family protein [Endobacterium cereale]